MERKNIDIKLIEPNNGQIEGLPSNPRFIKDKRFLKLVKSIEDAPEMLEYRTLLVYPQKDKFIAICGNMRLRACQKIGYKTLPCVVLNEDTPVEKLREYTIKDNVGFGEDDLDALANEWDEKELLNFGMEFQNELEKSENEKYEIEEIETRPFYKNHILISYNIDDHDKVIKIFDVLKNIDCEILTSAN